MKSFLRKLFSFLGIPILIIAFCLLLSYMIFDPFKVLFSYDHYSLSPVVPNRDYISSEIYLNNRGKYQYNSFIFGNSRTYAFNVNAWKKYLDKNAKPFVFDASSETIDGIYSKIRFIDSTGGKLDNVLILVCRNLTFNKKFDGHLFLSHPVIAGNSKLMFQFAYFKAYTNINFLKAFYSYKIFGKYEDWMENYLSLSRNIGMDPITNQITVIDYENEILTNKDNYYKKRINIFYTRTHERIDSINRINAGHVFMLNEIKRIFKKNNTHYKIIISPLYEQMKFTATDKKILEHIFQDNLYDFSGKNKFTDSITNYHEASHFRPLVGDSILSIIY